MDFPRPLPARDEALTTRSRLILAVFTAAVFTSALLLFAVQPMFTRMVLPRLGGTPAVWSVAMVFFQSMLLAGYAYADGLARIGRPPLAVGVHLALLIAALLTLPLSIAAGWGTPPSRGEALWLIGLFAVSIGLPFFALSANNPLLQWWFVATRHRDAEDPYFLYAASNVGSFLALIAYPALLEPLLPLRDQNRLWSAGFIVLIALVAACGLIVLRRAHAPVPAAQAAPAAAPSWLRVGRWICLSAVPSGLLVAVTAHISTDVAAVPLLWVLPLSLYLLTWVLVFQRRPLIPHRWMLVLQPVAIAGLVVLLALAEDVPLWLMLGGHLGAFFVIAVTSHGELARDRPPPRHLTTFYLSLSAGGMIGGLFAGLIAPFAFSWVAEYPILIALAALCRPAMPSRSASYERVFWAAAVVIAVAAVLPGLAAGSISSRAAAAGLNGLILVALAALFLARDRLKLAFAIAVALAMVRLYPQTAGHLETVRSFFGVHKIWNTPDGQYRVLIHGTTPHGAQRIRDASGQPLTGRPEPLTYYHPETPLAEAVTALRARKGGPIRVGVVGLGTGSLACHRAEGERWRFYEIDPDVVRIARDPRRFTFLQSCAPEAPVVLGDARLTLAGEPDGSFDVLVIDAFSSDAIPTHLLTREAMAIYKAKVVPGGAVIMHVSNRHLELATVVAGIAAANGLKTWVNDSDLEEREPEYIFSSTVAIAAADAADIGALADNEDWEPTDPDPAQRTWSDDYSNVLGALLRYSGWQE